MKESEVASMREAILKAKAAGRGQALQAILGLGHALQAIRALERSPVVSPGVKEPAEIDAFMRLVHQAQELMPPVSDL